MKTLTIVLIGLVIFTAVYTLVVFNSDFGVPNVVDYSYGYPCDKTFVQSEDLFGYQFENCYILKLNFWNKE